MAMLPKGQKEHSPGCSFQSVLKQVYFCHGHFLHNFALDLDSSAANYCNAACGVAASIEACETKSITLAGGYTCSINCRCAIVADIYTAKLACQYCTDVLCSLAFGQITTQQGSFAYDCLCGTCISDKHQPGRASIRTCWGR